LENYYNYRFYEQKEVERAAWITYRHRICFFRKVNPAKYKHLVDDKVQASQFMAEFIKRDFFPLSDISELDDAVDWILQRDEVVVKPRFGMDGKGVRFIKSSLGRDALRQFLKDSLQTGAQTIEELIEQHPQMSALHADSVNTLRIQTVLHNDEVHILGAVLRIGNGSRIDNMVSGGLAAAVDIASGKVMSAGYFMDITKGSSLTEHPITGIRIPGFEIPFWQETLDFVRQMATRLHMLKALGWDIAISSKGPVLVEYNRIWGTTTFQVPYKKGRLQELAPFMDPNCLYPVQRKHLSGLKK